MFDNTNNTNIFGTSTINTNFFNLNIFDKINLYSDF